MNIAIDIRNIGRQRTGSEVVVLELTRKLLSRDSQDTYFLVTDTDDVDVHRYIKKSLALDHKNHVSIVALKTRSRAKWVLYEVPLFCKKYDIDLFWTEYIVPFFISRKTKVVTHIHDVSFQAIRAMIGKKDLLYLDLMIPRSLRRADAIVAVSAFTEQEIFTFYPYIKKDKVQKIYNACGEQFYAAVGEQELKIIEKKYNLPQKYIFALGTMQPRKNIPLIIEAFAKIAHRIGDTDLVLSGKQGHHYDTLIDDIIERYPYIKNRIHFTGYIDAMDLPGVYQNAHVFVYPSLYEGFGIPLLEAFWSDVPVVASDTQIHREIAGDAACFFDPISIDQCADSLYDCCIDEKLRTELTEKGKQRRLAYSWDDAAKKMNALFHVLHNL